MTNDIDKDVIETARKDLGLEADKDSEVGPAHDPSRARRKPFSVKRYLPHSLLGRSLLILILPVVLIQLVTTIVFFDNHWKKMMDRLAYAAAGEIAVIAQAIENGAGPDTEQRITRYVSQNLDLLISFDADKKMDSADGGAPSHNFWEKMVVHSFSNELDRHLNRPFHINADFEEKWIQVDAELRNGVLTVVLPERRLFSSSGYIFLIWMFLTSFIMLLIAILFMRNQIRPIHRLAVAAEWFGRGRDVPSFKIQGASEVRRAGQAFLDMRRRIKRQISQRTLMLAGVSHDLRTPLTRLKLELSMLENDHDVSSMRMDIADMEKMIAGYLDFVKGTGAENPEKIKIADLINKICGAPQLREVNIHKNVPVDLLCTVKPMAFERCLTNLIGNAAVYGKNIWIEAFRTDQDRIKIIIEDDGPGIPKEKYDDVFRPFFRVDQSRNPKTGGVGLGMPIAMDIVHSHGGKIWLEESIHGGLKVVVRMPV